jgi:signal transduction histidine kinase
LHLAAIDCQAVVEEVVATLRLQAEDKGLSLDVSIADRPLTVHTDRRALNQIIINLTSNAIKFTERGSIRLSIEKKQEQGKAVVAIGVHDTGIGIRPEDRGKLFTAFMRVIAGAKSSEGTGLGLHLSQKLAQLLGGRIDLESEHGKGSTFTLVLPER